MPPNTTVEVHFTDSTKYRAQEYETGRDPTEPLTAVAQVFCRLIIVLTCGLGELTWGAANLFIGNHLEQTPLRTHETHQ
jgi:hypothetical protein